jgi:hypothetical protein
MDLSLSNVLALYDAGAPLEEAYTIPAAWYVDERIARIEHEQVFGNNWTPNRSSWFVGGTTSCGRFTMFAATMPPP